MAKSEPYIISITGTKGKTTITRALSHVFTKAKHPTLRVDTDGHYLNDKQQSTSEDSQKLYGLLPATCPGRYLYELKDKKNAIAVLETAYLSGTVYGIGYFLHDIGIFTNIYDDHIGRKVRTREEMAHRKASYVFGQIRPNGTAIFNADDQLVCKSLDQIPSRWKVKLLPVGINFKHFDTEEHLASGGSIVVRQDNEVGIKSKKGFEPIMNVTNIPWTFKGLYYPSVFNLMCIIGALWTKSESNKIPEEQLSTLESYRMDKTGGRLTVLRNEDRNITAIVDYAHETQSLKEIAGLAKKLATRKTIGIIRLQASRSDELITTTGKELANAFDVTIVYDKIDGIEKHEFSNYGGVRRGVGEVSQIFFDAIRVAQDKNHTSHRIVVEKEAIRKAFEIANDGDVVIHIANDNHAKSTELISKYLHG